MVIIPYNSYLIVEPIQQDEAHSEGLEHFSLPPAEFVGAPNIGIVKYLAKDMKTKVKVGDKVIFDVERPHGLWFNGVRVLPVKSWELRGLIT